jgi:hypothetical protein
MSYRGSDGTRAPKRGIETGTATSKAEGIVVALIVSCYARVITLHYRCINI